MNLSTNLNEVSPQFKRYRTKLEKLNLETVEDLLYHVPYRYIDYSVTSNIADIQQGEVVTLRGTVVSMRNVFTKYGKNFQQAVISDQTGQILLVWFNQQYLTKVIREGEVLAVSGKVDFFGKKLAIVNPDYEQSFGEDNIHTGRLVPVYSVTKGISSKWLRRQVYNILNKIAINDTLPTDLIARYKLEDLDESIRTVHFPENIDEVKTARNRLSFDELLYLQLTGLHRKQIWKDKTQGNKFEVKKFEPSLNKIIESLPYKLTNGQAAALDQIKSDLGNIVPMNRLLQGDVGSGKTVVATISMYLAHLNGYQSALLAPTEILAEQHFESIRSILGNSCNIVLQTGSKKNIKDSTEYDIIIGTHAILHDSIKFTNLGLIVIDEQQRFGVRQRTILREKGNNPHFLTMTATPIPRTVALTMYSDLALSYLDELPKGRKNVKTWLVSDEKRGDAYEWIKKEIKSTNSQVFIVCPFIEESDSMVTVKAATLEYERLKKEVFTKEKLGLLHGKLSAKDKNQIVKDFHDKKYDILVSTPVIEVGIDIKNASIILIETADRFGLSQLHQLRGRVGRGDKQSYCLLFSESKNDNTLTRLKSLEKINNGAELAELDMKLRGPGEIFGTAQSGIPNLNIASFSDTLLIQTTSEAARYVFENPNKYKALNEKIVEKIDKTIMPD